MLYGNDNEKNEIIQISEYSNFKYKKYITLCIFIFICIIIVVCAIFFYKKNNNDSNSIDVIKNNVQNDIIDNQVNQNNNIQEGHIQIEQHDMEKIKESFRIIPKYNENSQQEVTNIYYSEEKIAYLTFDDGPSRDVTPQILDILKQENISATFFVLGSRVDLYPNLLQREYDEGHYIANHGYSHEYSKIYASKDTVFEEYIKCENSIRSALSIQDFNTYLFRFPGGSSGGKYNRVKTEAKELLHNYAVTYTNWNCLTGDAAGNTTHDALMNELINTMSGDGSLIILMHDANDKTYTVEVLPSVIAYLREQGYQFKNFYEIFK